MGTYTHYVRLGDGNVVVHAFSDGFEVPGPTDVIVAQNAERHCEILIRNDAGGLRLKWNPATRQIEERTEEEIEPLADLKKRLVGEITLQARSSLRDTDPVVLGYLEEDRYSLTSVLRLEDARSTDGRSSDGVE